MMVIKEFPADGAFGSHYAACDWLRARGFSFGSSQAGAPIAVWHGDCIISKWRNLSNEEKRSAHAIMEGQRDGPTRITLRNHAPAEAVAAFNQEGSE